MATAVKKPAAKRPTIKESTRNESGVSHTNAKVAVQMSTITDVFPDEDDQLSFLRGCICLAQADGAVDESERAFFLNAAAGLGLSDNAQADVIGWLEEEQDLDDVSFDTKQQALFFLREVLQICYLDGHFSDAEREVLTEMCSNFGVSRASFEYIEEWVKDGMTWRQDGERLLDLED